MCKTVFEYMVIFSYCFEAHQTPAARHPFCHGLIFWDLAIHFRSRPRDISQPSLQNFRPRTDSFIWAVDKVFCISSSWFVVLPLLQIFFCNFLATTWIPCQLYSKFIVSCIVGALYTFNHLFSLSGFYFVCFSFSLFFCVSCTASCPLSFLHHWSRTCFAQVLHFLFHPMQRSHDEGKKEPGLRN